MIEKKDYIVDLNDINLHQEEELISIKRDVDVGAHIPQDIIGKGLEFTNIRNTENIELSRLWIELNKLMENSYIQSANKMGIDAYKRLINDEKIKGNLEEQRKLVYTLWNMARVWTHRTLISWLDEYLGSDNYRLNLIYDEYGIAIEILVNNKLNLDELYSMLRKDILPANLEIELRIKAINGLVFREKTDTYTSRLYPVSTYHQCGSIYKHQYVGKKINSNIKLPNGARNRSNRKVFVGERKAGAR